MNMEKDPQIPFAIVTRSASRKFLCAPSEETSGTSSAWSLPDKGEVAFCRLVLVESSKLGVLKAVLRCARGGGIVSAFAHVWGRERWSWMWAKRCGGRSGSRSEDKSHGRQLGTHTMSSQDPRISA